MLKNWVRLFYILFSVAGVAVYLALFALKPKGVTLDIQLACFLLAPMLFFTGTILYNLFMFSAKTSSLANYLLLVTGLLVTVAFCISAEAVYKEMGLADVVAGVGNTVQGSQPAPSDMAKWYSQVLVSFAFVGQLIVFGLMPLLKGISKTLAATPMPGSSPAEPNPELGSAKKVKKEKPPKEKKEKPNKEEKKEPEPQPEPEPAPPPKPEPKPEPPAPPPPPPPPQPEPQPQYQPQPQYAPQQPQYPQYPQNPYAPPPPPPMY